MISFKSKPQGKLNPWLGPWVVEARMYESEQRYRMCIEPDRANMKGKEACIGT
jgi:hypothetical protein